MYQFERDKSSAVYLLNNIVSIDDEPLLKTIIEESS